MRAEATESDFLRLHSLEALSKKAEFRLRDAGDECDDDYSNGHGGVEGEDFLHVASFVRQS